MKPLRVALPLGLGDCHWVCTKLRALSEYHDGRPIEAHVNKSDDHASVGYLRLVPQIAEAIEDARAPWDVARELPGGHLDPRWSTLEGSAGWQGFDYCLVANGHLERGEPLSSYLAPLETDYVYPLNIREQDVEYAHLVAPPGSVLLYPSGMGPNLGFHHNSWEWNHWVRVVELLNGAGIEPVFVGAHTREDMSYWMHVRPLLLGTRYTDAVGRTTVPQIMALIRQAGAWCGLNSGLGIVSAMLGTPTVMLWADRRYPVGSVAFDPVMQTSWLSEDQLETYRTLSYGSSEMTPANVVARILEVKGIGQAVAA